MESKDLKAEGEALRRTLERIEFLVQQGLISRQAADCRKQGVMDRFCLAPMIDRQRLQGESNAIDIGAGRSSMDFAVGGTFASFPALAAAAFPAISCAATTAAVDSISSSIGLSAGPSQLPPSRSLAEGSGSPETSQTKRRRLSEGGQVHSELEGAGLLLARVPECQMEGCHLLPTCGDGGGSARFCVQHRSVGMLHVLPAPTPESPNPLTLADMQSPHERSIPDVPSPRTSNLAQPREARLVVPELASGTRVAGDLQTIRFLQPHPRLSSIDLLGCSASMSTSTSGSVSSATSGGCPVTTSGGDTMQMLSIEAEPTPPTVPDPADLKRGSCEWPDCTKEPHYAVKGQRALTCYAHKQEGWVHVSRRRCDMDGCPRGAYFSLQGSTAIFCSTHRTPAMLDVVNLRRYKCHAEDCRRQAYYNFIGVVVPNKAKFCSTHKLPDMINVRHRLCENEGCPTTPTYSFAGDRPRFCAAHKAEGMVDTKSKTCAFVEAAGSNCAKCRLYGVPGGKATYCFAHKKDAMINIRQARKRQSS